MNKIANRLNMQPRSWHDLLPTFKICHELYTTFVQGLHCFLYSRPFSFFFASSTTIIAIILYNKIKIRLPISVLKPFDTDIEIDFHFSERI